MTHSEKATKLVESFEGLETTAYRDQRDIWTIGYGHTSGVKEGMTCTPAQANTWLNQDLATADHAVNAYITADLTQNMFDALVSFTFNVGAGNLEHSTLRQLLNGGSKLAAADQFLVWNHTNGVVNAGLTRRRQAERSLFLQP
jgi:lysozyme